MGESFPIEVQTDVLRAIRAELAEAILAEEGGEMRERFDEPLLCKDTDWVGLFTKGHLLGYVQHLIGHGERAGERTPTVEENVDTLLLSAFPGLDEDAIINARIPILDALDRVKGGLGDELHGPPENVPQEGSYYEGPAPSREMSNYAVGPLAGLREFWDRWDQIDGKSKDAHVYDLFIGVCDSTVPPIPQAIRGALWDEVAS